jgi:hypothetical protein
MSERLSLMTPRPDRAPSCPHCGEENLPASSAQRTAYAILGASVVLMLAGTVHHDIHGELAQRWALFLQLFGGLAYLHALARWIVNRSAQVHSYYYDDVDLGPGGGGVVVPFQRPC